MSFVRSLRDNGYSRKLRHKIFVSMFGDFNKMAEERDIPISPDHPFVDDHTDAFRHTMVSASLTARLYFALEPVVKDADHALHIAEVIADFLGYTRKKKLEPGRSNTNMDLYNEGVGRAIARELINEGVITRKTDPREVQELLADSAAEAVKENMTINKPSGDSPRYVSRFEGTVPEVELNREVHQIMYDKSVNENGVIGNDDNVHSGNSASTEVLSLKDIIKIAIESAKNPPGKGSSRQ